MTPLNVTGRGDVLSLKRLDMGQGRIAMPSIKAATAIWSTLKAIISENGPATVWVRSAGRDAAINRRRRPHRPAVASYHRVVLPCRTAVSYFGRGRQTAYVERLKASYEAGRQEQGVVRVSRAN